MTCKDCIHYEICQIFSDQYGISKVYPSECGYAQDKSRLIELPCKLGDDLFDIVGDCGEEEIVRGEVVSFNFDGVKVNIFASYECGLRYWYSEEQIGKTVFLTREEAEEKLKETKK